MVGDEWVDVAHEAAERYGTPFYLYDFAKVEERILALSAATQGAFHIRYATKANPNPALLRWLRGRVASLDVSSVGELVHATNCGWSAADLEFTGPAKTETDLRVAIDLGLGSLVLEDEDEIDIVERLAAERARVVPVVLRISPRNPENGFAVRLAGRPTQFGIDEEIVSDVVDRVSGSSHLRLKGFHVFSGSQCLDGQALAQYFRNLWELFLRVGSSPGVASGIEELVFGGGLGIPYHEGDGELSLAPLSAVAIEIAGAMRRAFPEARAFIESGRYLVGEAGLFVTRIVRVKTSRGLRIGVCDGGMNHNLGACGHLGGVSHRHYALRNLSARSGGVPETIRLVGPLCTAIDTLALRAELPELSSGDLIGVSCAGAYGPTASPLYFIGHALPREVLVSRAAPRPVEFQDVSWLGGAAAPSEAR